MTYNLTELGAAEYMQEVVVYANNATGDILMISLVVTIFFIMMMANKSTPFLDRLTAYSFICFILSLALFYAQLMPFIVLLIFLAMTAFGVFAKIYDGT